MALTIDDTPSEYTREILQIIQANQATATFFVIGDQIASSDDEEVLRDLILAGNELGNHAMHDEPSRSLGDEDLAAQIRMVDARLQAVYNTAAEEALQRRGSKNTSDTSESEGHRDQDQSQKMMMMRPTMVMQQRQDDQHRQHGQWLPPKFFRPGSGFFSSRMLRVMDDLGYRLALGDVYPHDPILSSWKINSRHILSMLRPGGIIVCHDRRQWTPQMLRHVLPEMKRRGYRLVTLSELCANGQQK